MARPWLFAILALGACGGDSGAPGCTDIAQGDAILLVSEADSTILDVADGDTVPLIRPLQGGQILLVGVRVHTAAACTFTAHGTVYDGVTDSPLGSDIRTLTLEPRGDGWIAPQPGFITLLNVPVCPSGNASSTIDGRTERLEINVNDPDDQPVLTLSTHVVPMCSDAGCTMDCQKL